MTPDWELRSVNTGLQRGIDGSKARHKSTQQYYRDIQKLADNLKAEVVDLQQQKETAQEELRRAKKEMHNRRSCQHRREYRFSFRQQQGQDIGEVIAKTAWFPYLREMLRIENFCHLVGFDERQTATLISGKPLEYAGELYSEEHKRKFTTERAGFQVMKDTNDKTKLVLAINRQPIAEWFKEQFDKLRQNIRRPIQPQRKGRGMKL